LIKSLNNKDKAGNVIDSYLYEYDLANNQTLKTDAKGQTTYTYDTLNRLASETEPTGKKTTYAFDAAGNRAKETIAETAKNTINSYEYDEFNRLLKINSEENGVKANIRNYSYDNNGNQLTETKATYANGQLTTETTESINKYDNQNQLISCMKNSKQVEFKYNGLGQRVEKTADSVITRFLYDEEGNIVLETDKDGNEKARNIYGINLISREVNNEKAYYMYNAHGDVTALTDKNGNVIGKQDYDAFGNMTTDTTTFENLGCIGEQCSET
jgi:YD repeat-containing protein